MLSWMLYVIMVSALLSIGALLAERAARLRRTGTRWIWMTALAASLLLPTVISSVSVELPNVVEPQVAPKLVVLRQATSEYLSPVAWLEGAAIDPARWPAADALLKHAWIGVSVAMLVALLLSGVHLFARKRRWNRGAMAGAAVYITDDVGPAVVGLLRPRIVVPQWLTSAEPAQQAAVVAHEQSHLDAGDPQLFTAALFLLALAPWNLPMWWQLRRLRYAIEIDCDARVLKGGTDLASYGETLIAVGERRSAYVGAVAAMSESKSFLEERIEHMVKKPIGKGLQHAGVATLACFALALTALAAQVSPPNATGASQSAAEAASTEAPSTEAPPTSRRAIDLDATVLDRYTGEYQLAAHMLMKVTREGAGLMAQLTGQPPLQILPESEKRFFYEIVDAQIEFIAEGHDRATALTLYQNGRVLTMTRIDSAAAAQLEAELAAKVQAQVPDPASEAALLRLIAGIAEGAPHYEEMSPELAEAIRNQLPSLQAVVMNLGPVRTVEHRGVTPTGLEIFEIGHDKGMVNWRIHLAADGKIDGAFIAGL